MQSMMPLRDLPGLEAKSQRHPIEGAAKRPTARGKHGVGHGEAQSAANVRDHQG